MNDNIEEAYRFYYARTLIKNVEWAPSQCCSSCYKNLMDWMHDPEHKSMPFGIPMVWTDTSEHKADSCYFCVNKTFGYSSKSLHTIKYKGTTSASRPVLHSEELPVPRPPDDASLFSEEDEMNLFAGPSFASSSEQTSEFKPRGFSGHSVILITLAFFNDLCRVLELSQKKSELLASRLKQNNLLEPNVLITAVRNRQLQFQCYFTTTSNITYCHDIESVMNDLNIQHIPNEWRLFIDGSKESLKAVLLNNGNFYPSLPIAYAPKMKEDANAMKTILDCIQYYRHLWPICADFKVIALLMGLQAGFTKYSCFLCEWDSRARDEHYVRANWPDRQDYAPGSKNIVRTPLVDSQRVLLPPLHIKLGLVKNFVKAMDKEGAAFVHLRGLFPHLSNAKILEGKFVK